MDRGTAPDARPSRRAFLAAAGGLVVASGLVETAPAWAAPRYSPLVLSSDLYANPSPQRLVFAVAKGARFKSGAPARVRFKPPKGKFGPLLDTTLDRVGLPRGRGVYVSEPTFDVPGVWVAEARTHGKRLKFAVQIQAEATAPVVGSAAPRAASPTLANPLGVSPICTRSPQCPLHTASLSDVIGAGVPVAALFATPARCQSQYCGPVLDEFLSVMGPYQPHITFVHIEIYQAATGVAYVPTVEAWGLPSEPWLFGIDSSGTIVARARRRDGRRRDEEGARSAEQVTRARRSSERPQAGYPGSQRARPS